MSASGRRFLRVLIALALCLQSSLSMAQCLRLATPDPHRLEVLICTADGLVALHLPEPEEPPQHEGAPRSVPCAACQAPAAIALPEPPILPAPRLVAFAPAPLPRLAAPPPAARAPPYRPTGPPIAA